MLNEFPVLGARFDIEKISDGFYSFTCWKVIWQSINPKDIGWATLYEGDTAATLRGQERVFCIAIQCLDAETVSKIKFALRSNAEFNRICAKQMFVEGLQCTAEPLPKSGSINDDGSLSGGVKAFSRALEETIKDKSIAIELAKPTKIPINKKKDWWEFWK